eukprot:EST42404.1 Hypothetical protein SS50377_18051 [Spironucleus salmonicida]
MIASLSQKWIGGTETKANGNLLLVRITFYYYSSQRFLNEGQKACQNEEAQNSYLKRLKSMCVKYGDAIQLLFYIFTITFLHGQIFGGSYICYKYFQDDFPSENVTPKSKHNDLRLNLTYFEIITFLYFQEMPDLIMAPNQTILSKYTIFEFECYRDAP